MGQKVLYVRVPDELHQEVSRRADEHGVTVSAFVTRGLDRYLIDHFGWQGLPANALP